MTWTKTEIRNNASILYNYLCLDSSKTVYVDKGHFKIDERNWLSQWWSPVGDRSKEAIDKIVIKTLEQLSKAIQKGTIQPNKIIRQESLSHSLIMDESEDIEVYKEMHLNADKQFYTSSSDSASSSKSWVNKRKFALTLNGARRFKVPMKYGTDSNDFFFPLNNAPI